MITDQQIAELVRALKALHDETAEYIYINNLGNIYHNKSMQDAKQQLDLFDYLLKHQAKQRQQQTNDSLDIGNGQAIVKHPLRGFLLVELPISNDESQ